MIDTRSKNKEELQSWSYLVIKSVYNQALEPNHFWRFNVCSGSKATYEKPL
jgi:hypothetical protein